MQSLSLRRLSLGTVALAAVAALGGVASAEEPAATAAPPAHLITVPHATLLSGPATLAGGDSGVGEGMRAAIDPVTGELRPPSAAQLRLLDAQSATLGLRTAAAPVQVERPDGTVMMALSAELMNYSIAEIGLDGTVSFRCVDGPTQADIDVYTPGAGTREVK